MAFIPGWTQLRGLSHNPGSQTQAWPVVQWELRFGGLRFQGFNPRVLALEVVSFEMMTDVASMWQTEPWHLHSQDQLEATGSAPHP